MVGFQALNPLSPKHPWPGPQFHRTFRQDRNLTHPGVGVQGLLSLPAVGVFYQTQTQTTITFDAAMV